MLSSEPVNVIDDERSNYDMVAKSRSLIARMA